MKKKRTFIGTLNYYWKSKKGYYYMANSTGTKRISKSLYESIE